jgi:hypothetical protein
MKATDVQFNFTLNSGSFSWQKAYFELLHEALVEAFNEIVINEEDVDIEWKDNEAIQWHVEETGLLDRTLALAKQKFFETSY